ncbi:MAG: [acyl-carrier-protein] S-malonyltransferase [Sphingobacteriales bacterium]
MLVKFIHFLNICKNRRNKKLKVFVFSQKKIVSSFKQYKNNTMKAYVFPGQGSQFPGMGKDLYDSSTEIKALFDKANEVLGFSITDIMFNGTDEDLKETKVTQPAIFIQSVAMAKNSSDFNPSVVAGHSLGEFSALTAAGALTFEDGLKLVSLRANAMQKACELEQGTMAAILGLDDDVVEKICASIDDVVVPANYNCPGQLVISGSVSGITTACEKLTEAGARRALVLAVGGAFHSPLMEPARVELAEAIAKTNLVSPKCPIYQNVNAKAFTTPEEIKTNLIAQLTSPVKWTQTVQNMIADGATSFTEVGPGKVLQGMVKKIDRQMECASI